MAKKIVTFATQYDYDSIPRPQLHPDPNAIPLVNQSDKDSVDLNLMFKRYEKEGLIPDIQTGNLRPPQYTDFTKIPDFFQMQNQIARVTQAFNAYPAHIRARFQNEPAKLIEFLSDPKNEPEAIRLGLKPAPKSKVREDQEKTPAGSEATPPGSSRESAADPKGNKNTLPPKKGEE